jgi:hypothetical protein
MAKSKAARRKQFMPDGVPRWVRIYDNTGTDNESADCFTVIFTGRYREQFGGQFQGLGMGRGPYHPQGVCMHFAYDYQVDTVWHYKDGRPPKHGVMPPAMGRKCHLGKRIPFSELNEDCRMAVLQDYFCIWDLLEEMPEDGYIDCDTIAPIMLKEFGIRYERWLPKEDKKT